MMERPFFSLSKGKRLEPIDYRPERWLDRSILWNDVEAIERRKDAVLARAVEFALPRELSQAESIALAQDFVRQQFVSQWWRDLNVHWTREPLRLTLGAREQPNRMAAR
jgi:ATP-dependent exoDNAse (exonuclease V) alpha subunit